jgi:hypothetical protein
MRSIFGRPSTSGANSFSKVWTRPRSRVEVTAIGKTVPSRVPKRMRFMTRPKSRPASAMPRKTPGNPKSDQKPPSWEGATEVRSLLPEPQ